MIKTVRFDGLGGNHILNLGWKISVYIWRINKSNFF